ncbi:protein ENHANCED DOWNY MILDEW 2-like isoform X2 [Vicia villosa]|uniref:protein ENHANCED DOWNY MILDEW 2-like isoform X2 n=1 Tax=Vicia villosa TaxID=3911 RepID=UPI00273CD1A7|nr:protein ENHANCED DOWNY MILDEW 2-like isoform X2 [Vicia villosa]
MSSILFSSSYGFKSSHKDLLDHMSFVGEATRIDVVLARCKMMIPTVTSETNEDSKVDDDLFDSVCAMCDDGDDIIMSGVFKTTLIGLCCVLHDAKLQGLWIMKNFEA